MSGSPSSSSSSQSPPNHHHHHQQRQQQQQQPTSSSTASPSGIRAYFKTPEGRYRLSHEKKYPTGLLHSSANQRSPTKITLAQLDDRPTVQPPAPPAVPSGSAQASSGPKFITRSLLGGSGTGKVLGFGGGNGRLSSGKSGAATSSWGGATSAAAAAGVSPALGSGNGPAGSGAGAATSAAGGAGGVGGELPATCIIFNVGETLVLADFNSLDKDPLKTIVIANSFGLHHTFDSEAKEGHDLLIGCIAGDLYTMSLRQQLQEASRKLVGAVHYNKDGVACASRLSAVAWVPRGSGSFVAAHVDGNVYVYEKGKESGVEASFPAIRDSSAFSVATSKSPKTNPVARWHLSPSPISAISFSPHGNLLAAVSREGCLRIFDWARGTMEGGTRSYFGAINCCCFSPDGRYILTGGEDDLVQIFGVQEQAVMAWCEGHSSWVTGLAFDPVTSSSNGGNGPYRFASVGQDTQLLLWDIVMDDVKVPNKKRLSFDSPWLGASQPSVSSPAGSIIRSLPRNRSSKPEARSGPVGDASRALPSGGSDGQMPSLKLPQGAFSPAQSQSSARESSSSFGGFESNLMSLILQPPPLRKDAPRISPFMAHKVHLEPLSCVAYAKDALLTSCFDGIVKVWNRPAQDSSEAHNGRDSLGSGNLRTPFG